MVLSTALALASVGSQLAGSAMSFEEARKQKRLQAQAEKEADIAMASALKSLEKNRFDPLAIQLEPYRLESEDVAVAGAQAIEALRESDRGMGRVGAIYGQQQQAQRQIASAMGQEMFELDYLSAQEDARKDDLKAQLLLGELTGAQLAAANAEERRAQQLQAGVAGIGGAAMTGLDALALYKKDKDPKAPTLKQVERIKRQQALGNFEGQGLYRQDPIRQDPTVMTDEEFQKMINPFGFTQPTKPTQYTGPFRIK